MPLLALPSNSLRVLLVEDSTADAELIRIALEKSATSPIELTHAVRLVDAAHHATCADFDIMVLDLSLPDSHGLETVLSAGAACPKLPIVVLTETGDPGVGLAAVRSGAQDCVSKLELERIDLLRTLQHAIARAKADAERERTERQSAAIQKLESLGLIASGVVRDFNDLLMSVLGNVRLALSELPKVSNVRPILEDIEQAGLSATHLTRQLAVYAGQAAFRLQKVHISSLVSDLKRRLEGALTRSPTIVYELGGNLSRGGWIAVDAEQMRQALANLIVNAAEAQTSRDSVVTIRTAVMQASHDMLSECYPVADLPEGDYACIEIADCGCGIDSASLKRIFDPFYTTKFPGRGLGLPAALGIVRSHGGAIGVESTPMRGTKIRVLLPCADGLRPPATPTRILSSSATGYCG